jgi:hypothetical protein
MITIRAAPHGRHTDTTSIVSTVSSVCCTVSSEVLGSVR